MEEVCAEEEPLFQSLEDNLNEAEDGFTSTLSRPLPKRRKYSYLLYGLIIAYLPALLLYAFLAFGFVVPKASSHAIDLNLFPSLASTWRVETKSKIYKLRVIDSNFTGKPEPVIDQSWHDLLEGVTFRASKEDLDFYNVTSVPLADGSGYATELFMTHELHCLKLIRKWKYKEFYYVSELKEQGPALAELDRHVDHCIETLRQGIMCRGDVSLATYSYIKGTKNVTARTWGHHQCIDYDSLMAWVKERAVDIFQEGALMPPDQLL